MSEVEKFIERFRTKETIEVFTRGCCYWFAYILCGRFPQAELMYDLTENHFMVEIDGRLYDITGDVSGVYTPIPWDFYDDIVHKRRIERDCVLFANLKDT